MKRLKASSMGSGRTFYADEPEDLAYLKQLSKEKYGDEDLWPELSLRIYGRQSRTVKVELTVENNIGGIPGTLTRLVPPDRIKQIIQDEVDKWRDLKVKDIQVVVL